MKSYEEMAEDIFRRRDEYLEKKRKTRKIIFSGLSPAVCGCLVIAMTMGFFVKADNNTEPQNTDEIATQTQIEEKDDKLSILENEDIIWADVKSMEESDVRGGSNKYGVSIMGELNEIIDDLDEDQLIMVCASGGAWDGQLDKFNTILSSIYYKVDSGEVHKFEDEMYYYMYTTLWELRNKGMSWNEIIKSGQGIDYFYELYNAEYGRVNMYRLEAKALEKYHLDECAELESLGFNIIYDGTDVEWGTFFRFRGMRSSCVVLTTPRQLKELGKTESSYRYNFTLAPKDPVIAYKHMFFNMVYQNMPSRGFVNGYNGNVDEFYELVLKEREAKGE